MSKCRVILDCAKVFIERPKLLDCQAATWSDCKQQNTIKSEVLLHFYVHAMVAEQVISSSLRIVAFMTFLSVAM